MGEAWFLPKLFSFRVFSVFRGLNRSFQVEKRSLTCFGKRFLGSHSDSCVRGKKIPRIADNSKIRFALSVK